MRQVKLGNLSLQVPESWADVTLDRYNAAIATMQKYKEVPRQAMGLAISELCSISEARLMSMQKAHIMQLRESLDFFFKTQPKPRIQMEFEIGGTIFKVPSEVEAATFGEFVDMDSIIVANKEDLRLAMPGILAVYCRPMGEVYNTTDLKKRAAERTKLMGQLPIELAEGIAAFFLTSTQASPSITLQYGLNRVSLVARVRTMLSLPRPTGGLQRLLHWQRMRFLRYVRSRIGDAMKS